MLNSLASVFSSLANVKASISGFPSIFNFAFKEDFKKGVIFTPGISTGY